MSETAKQQQFRLWQPGPLDATKQQQFKLWQPGPLDAVRRFLLSESFQSAFQLAAGVLFVSLFVLVDLLRFPGSCVAILLYFVVAVTAAPDCHVGTRIFLCGFMSGPMWLSLLLGGVIATLSKLAPTREAELVIDCVLGSLALIPFAANRMGTSHVYMFAMGMVSALYLGMPLLAGWGTPDIVTLWKRAVGFVLVSALIGMFAGSVLSMIVLPSLASHELEDEVSAALRKLGQHLSAAASQLWRPGKTKLQGLPRHLEDLHPLLLPSVHGASEPGVVAPGVLDMDITAAPVSPSQVYVAAMDYFEHLSRPPSASAAGPGRGKSCFAPCRTSSASGSTQSEQVRSTFWGPSAGSMAAAVAAAAQDYEEEQELARFDSAHLQQQRAESWAVPSQQTSSALSSSTLTRRQPSAPCGPSELRLGSTLTAAAAKAAKADAVRQQRQPTATRSTANGQPVFDKLGVHLENSYSSSSSKLVGAAQPCPSIAEVRQLLAHATQLLMSAGAEPRWLRSGERPFQVAAWTKLVQAAQLVALRLTALDLAQRDFVSLSEEPHSFPVAEELSQLLLRLYGSAAAALAMLSTQIGNRQQLTETCAANLQILKHPTWQGSRQRLLQLLEDMLAEYYLRIQQASPEAPVVIPSSHWVRRWMFFHTTTLSLMTALDGLAAAAEGALAVQPYKRSARWWQLWRRPPAPQQPDASTDSKTARKADVETGLQAGNQDGVRLQETADAAGPAQNSTNSSSGTKIELVSHSRLHSLTSLRVSSPQDPAAAAAAADAEGLTLGDAAAGPPSTAQQPLQPLLESGAAAKAASPPAGAAAGSPAAAAAGPSGLSARLKASLMRHTGWIRPWLPLALNVEQYKNLQLVAREVPAAFSSWAAFKATLCKRRVQAAIKYWSVLVLLFVGTLLLQYFVPVAGRLNPSFGYTAAAVGMSDRVESTVFKVATWTGATIIGAFIGWALMATPAMALNPVALGAVMCTISFFVGTLERGPTQGGTLFTLFTLTTLASIVMCQCCGHLGSTYVSMVRGASVLVAAVIAVSVQNLVWPWYTSTWALEQVGMVFREGTEVLADLVCQLYEETDNLMQQQGIHLSDVSDKDPADVVTAAAAAAAAAANATGGGGGTQRAPAERLQMLTDAVRRVWLREQQEQQQQEQQGEGALQGAASGRTGDDDSPLGQIDEHQTQQQGEHQQQQQQGPPKRHASFAASVATNRLAELGRQLSTTGTTTTANQFDVSQGRTSSDAANAAAAAAIESALSESSQTHSHALSEMAVLLQQRRTRVKQQMQQQQQGPKSGPGPVRVSVSALSLQARLLRPLIQVKMSLVLDTTAWKSGPLATPPLVLHMVAAMFDLVDALAALQQAVSMPVKALSGSWDWTLLHVAGAWAALLLQAIQLAEATATHVLQPTAESAEDLLAQIQEVSHKRFEHFAVQRELRRLMHTALVTDEALAGAHQRTGLDEWELQGHLRYSACVYATGKVLDCITAAARCALNESKIPVPGCC